MVLAKENFNCETECQSIFKMTQVMFKEKNQHFEVKKEMEHRYFYGDIMRIKRVIINLLNNASKFTPPGGTITLTVSESPRANANVSMVTFAVTDSGRGIPEKELASIFKPFYQVESADSTRGTGLGLSIVKSIVETKGGTISVTSAPGEGSTFTIILPMERVAEKDLAIVPQAPASKAVVDLSAYHILLVEDHPINTLVAKRLLEKCGATVDTATNGALGYDRFMASAAGQYNLIFMDLQMPVMNGYETTQAIRHSHHPQAATIPIIAMTANAYAEDVCRCLDSGMNGHLAKPITIKAMAEVIDQCAR